MKNGTCKSLGLRTTMLSAPANPRAQVWAPGGGLGKGGPEGAGELVASLGSPGVGSTPPIPPGLCQASPRSRMQDV